MQLRGQVAESTVGQRVIDVVKIITAVNSNAGNFVPDLSHCIGPVLHCK